MEKLGERTWILTDNLVFYSKRFGGKFTVPRGFQTDFASIPRIFWTILPPVGRYDKAAVIHDAGYENAIITTNGQRVYLLKKFCDEVFYDAMRCEGVNYLLAKTMFHAVSLAGNADGHPIEANHG
jgi:hypothetical protein